MPTEADLTHTSSELVLSEVRGLASTVNARFDSAQRETDDMKNWMGRLSNTLEKTAEATTKFMSMETRVVHVENGMSDYALDLADVKDDVSTMKQEVAKNSVTRNWTLAAGASFLGAIATLALPPIMHWFHI